MAKDYISEYKGHCLTCKKYDIYSKSDATIRGFRCIHHHRPMAMDESCPNHSLDYARSNYQIEEAVEWIGRRGYEPRRDAGSCYITTIACKILGLPDDCKYLTYFRKLRDDYMVKFPEGLKLLYAYDIYGVQISIALENLYNNPQTKEYAEKIVKHIVVPHYFDIIASYLEQDNYEKAMNHYVIMSEMLGNIVGVKFQIPEVDVNTLDKEVVGHGRARVIEGV